MSQVLREAYQLRLGFFVVQRFMKNSLVLNMQGSLSAEMSHQSEAMSHHFDIFGYFWHPKGVFGVQGEIPSDQKHFVIQNAYLAKPEFSVLRWLMASGGGKGERTLVYWKSLLQVQVICLN